MKPDLLAAKEEIQKAQHRARQARYRAKNKTYLNEMKRRERKAHVKPLKIKSLGECYTLDHLARILGRNVHTVKEWTRRGIIPKGRYTYRNQQIYTTEEVEVINSAMKLLTSGFTSRYAYDQTIEVNGKRYSWKQYVWDRIHDIRRNQDGDC